MSEKLKCINVKRIYIAMSAILCVSIFAEVISLSVFYIQYNGGSFKLLALIFSIFFFLFSVFLCFRIAHRMIFRDMVTFLGNSTYVFRHAALLKNKKKLYLYTGALLNIKSLQFINQKYGVVAGDTVIQLYARILDNYSKTHHGFAGRIGGDNYFVLVRTSELEEFINFVNTQIYVPVLDEGEEKELLIKTRIGYEKYSNESDVGNMCFHGMLAIATAKRNKQDLVQFEQPILRLFEGEKLIISKSKAALKNHEFIPRYQPKVDINTGKIIGCEAVVRWSGKEHELQPLQFLPVLERDGCVSEVDFEIYEQVCRDLSIWISEGLNPPKISVNFSKIQINHPYFLDRLVRIKDTYKIDGKYLEVEFPESVITIDKIQFEKCVESIKDMGISIALDRFGEGFYSLGLLTGSKVDTIKLNKEFFDESLKNGKEQLIIDLITFAKHQGIEVIFVGVETQEQMDFLKQNNCPVVQGFNYDKPLSREEFEQRLKNPVYRK